MKAPTPDAPRPLLDQARESLASRGSGGGGGGDGEQSGENGGGGENGERASWVDSLKVPVMPRHVTMASSTAVRGDPGGGNADVP